MRWLLCVLLGAVALATGGLWPSAAEAAQQRGGTAGGQTPRTDEGQTPLEAAAHVDALLAEELFHGSSGAAGSVPGAVVLAPLTNDETFLRRLTLDLVGRLPSPAEITAFTLDRSAGKRTEAVERLLALPNFGRNWGRYWRDVIFYRRSDERGLLAAGAAERYLAKQFNKNTPWNTLAQSFITATGDVREEGTTALIAAQMGEVNDVTSEASRIFLGVQIQCAQCHDHPTDRWKRRQFHELAAFFPRIGLRPVRDGMKRSFEVVSHDQDRPRQRPMAMLRLGDLEHYMPDLKDPSSKGTLVQPVFFLTGQKLAQGETDLQRRDSLADWMTSNKNPWFAKAFVNRIWAELVGEGFYEPVDDLGPDRICSAGRTMDYLAAEFVAHAYDVKWLFRAVTGSQCYQRESRPRRNPDQTPFMANCSQRLRSDQIFDVLAAALGTHEGTFGPNKNAKRPMGGPFGQGGPRMQFAAVFGYDPSDRRDEISGSIPQALLLMNSPLISRAINGRNPNSTLAKLLADIPDDEQVAVELYLRCLGREPGESELSACREHVRTTKDRAAAFEDLFWALINSPEFLHRH
ncbi:MAG TPA: DUF1549 domain-containing protein [Pirellulales bacterium]|nr:DUF1549 domain-containing protein [Pirellulales bacterium]